MFRFIKWLIILISKITNSGMKVYLEDFNKCAKTYDEVLTRPVLAQATEIVLNKYGPSSGFACIDCGCGTGHATMIISEMIKPDGLVTACDFSDEMIKKSKQRLRNHHNINYLSGDMIQCLKTFENNAFDYAGLFWSLEYVKHAELLKTLYRKIKPGGKINILVNTRNSLIELQTMIMPIILKNIFCLKTIPPMNFISSAEEFEKVSVKAGFSTENISKESAEIKFSNGFEIVSWMRNGGPSAGFSASIKEKYIEKIYSRVAEETDKRGGLTVTFKYFSYSGIKK